MRNFMIYGEEDGEIKSCYASTNGKWKCLCCGKSLTADLVGALLAKHSANDDKYFEDRESA